LYYDFFDNNGSDLFFRSAYGPGHLEWSKIVRNDFASRVYNQWTGCYTPDETIGKANKDLLAVSAVLGGRKSLLGTERPTSFDAVASGMILSVLQAREMHPEATDCARQISDIAQHIRCMLEQYFPDLQAAF